MLRWFESTSSHQNPVCVGRRDFSIKDRRLGFLPALLIAALLLAACILLAGLSAGRQAPGSRPRAAAAVVAAGHPAAGGAPVQPAD